MTFRKRVNVLGSFLRLSLTVFRSTDVDAYLRSKNLNKTCLNLTKPYCSHREHIRMLVTPLPTIAQKLLSCITSCCHPTCQRRHI